MRFHTTAGKQGLLDDEKPVTYHVFEDMNPASRLINGTESYTQCVWSNQVTTEVRDASCDELESQRV